MSEPTGTHQEVESPEAPLGPAAGERYVINATVSRFTVQAFASGLLSAFGHNPKIAIRDLKGEIQFDPTQIEKSTMHLVIRADSLTVTDNISDKDRRDIEGDMREKVLETSKYPEITFDVSGVSVIKNDGGQTNATLNGQLSLHGVTRSQKIPSDVSRVWRHATRFRRILFAPDGLQHQAGFCGGRRLKG